MSKSKIYIPKSFESAIEFTPQKKQGKRKDVSSNIYYSMLVSNAWHNLTGKQKELYLFCKLQFFGQSINSKELKTDIEKNNKDDNTDISNRFVMNKSLWCKTYGLYTDSTQRYFYQDIKALIDNGFITELQRGKSNRSKNIYEFSNKWVELGKWEYK
jgi:hypothetical protein